MVNKPRCAPGSPDVVFCFAPAHKAGREAGQLLFLRNLVAQADCGITGGLKGVNQVNRWVWDSLRKDGRGAAAKQRCGPHDIEGLLLSRACRPVEPSSLAQEQSMPTPPTNNQTLIDQDLALTLAVAVVAARDPNVHRLALLACHARVLDHSGSSGCSRSGHGRGWQWHGRCCRAGGGKY